MTITAPHIKMLKRIQLFGAKAPRIRLRPDLGAEETVPYTETIAELTAAGLISEIDDVDIVLSDAGRATLKEYDKFGATWIFDHDYAFAVLAFLYAYDEYFKVDDFPLCILQNAPSRPGMTSENARLSQYLQFNADMKGCITERYQQFKLTDLGIEKYRHFAQRKGIIDENATPANGSSMIAPKNTLTTTPNVPAPKSPQPLVFIGSASESLEEVTALIGHLQRFCEVKPWNAEAFALSQYNLESLLRLLKDDRPDFAIFLLTGDDKLEYRQGQYVAPRDNVIFELGLAIGALSRDRIFMVIEDGVNLKLPTDLLGITPAKYKRPERTNISSNMLHVAGLIKTRMKEVGLRTDAVAEKKKD